MSFQFIKQYWMVCFIVFGILWYLFAFAGYRVQEDAKKRGLGKAAVTFWSVSVVFFGPLFLPLYMVFRSRSIFAKSPEEEAEFGRYKLCPHCGEENPFEKDFCNLCKKNLSDEKGGVGRKECTYCGADNPVDSRRCSACDQVIGYVDTDQD